MRNESKKVVSSLKMNDNVKENIIKYNMLLNTSYNQYSMIKASLNYFTMKETIEEHTDKNVDVCIYFNNISDIIKEYIIGGATVSDEVINNIKEIRDNIERKMHILTAFTDGYEVYEYILNRVEARVTDSVVDVDIDRLSRKMFQYIFSENDTVLINSKLQLIMSQLPVRMTKNKFFDILASTLAIYNAGETTSLNEFVEMIESTALLKLPDGFDTEYPYLYEVYCELVKTDYKTIDFGIYEMLRDKLVNAAKIIEKEGTEYILLQEIVNDVYCILLTINNSTKLNIDNKYFDAAHKIFEYCLTSENIDNISDELMDSFNVLEGAQEKTYESIMILEASFDEIWDAHSDVIIEQKLISDFKNLKINQKLISTSLFASIDEADKLVTQIVDNEYLRGVRDKLVTEFSKLFDANDRIVNRSIMCKVLSCMPVFMNTQQEIKNYFDYVLENCKDDSELTACSKLICDIIEEV